MKPLIFNLDIQEDSYESCDLMQGYDYNMQFNITDGYTALDLTGVTIQIQMQKADHKFIIQTEKITVVNNVINVEIDKDLTRENGKGKLQVVLSKDNKTFGSWVVKCNIKLSAINDNDGQSENKVTITEELTNKVTEANNAKVELDKSIANGDTEKMRVDIDKNSASLEDKANKDDVARISSGTPLFASNTTGMTDITRNYVNTTDGYLYKYNGTNFEKTTVLYQSTGISKKGVKNDNLYNNGTWSKILNPSNILLNPMYENSFESWDVSTPTLCNTDIIDVNEYKGIRFKQPTQKDNHVIFQKYTNVTSGIKLTLSTLVKVLETTGVNDNCYLKVLAYKNNVYVKAIGQKFLMVTSSDIGVEKTISYTITTEDISIYDELRFAIYAKIQGSLVVYKTSLEKSETRDIFDLNERLLSIEAKKLDNKKIVFVGDSIIYGESNGGGWCKLLKEKYPKSICVNKGVNGTTLAVRTGRTDDIYSRIETLDNDADYIVLEGGFNDFFNSIPIGIVSTTYPINATYLNGVFSNITVNGSGGALFDVATFCGALEGTIVKTLVKYPSKKICFILCYKVAWNKEQKDYWAKAVEILNKYSIKIINLYTDSSINGEISVLKDLYIQDGTHLNAIGYEKTLPIVENVLLNI